MCVWACVHVWFLIRSVFSSLVWGRPILFWSRTLLVSKNFLCHPLILLLDGGSFLKCVQKFHCIWMSDFVLWGIPHSATTGELLKAVFSLGSDPRLYNLESKARYLHSTQSTESTGLESHCQSGISKQRPRNTTVLSQRLFIYGQERRIKLRG
jgi:hypothetical protein